ncbi:hypothetical protein BDY19DRAFT_903638 [Irpex rosettiformis]|uniref:Uncharacterized protein n=1 Tax=Irpex rosettiformis TaxID=378272 RepID=A0ACB8UET4_9APHY|nr:hypothetical protein BDY19DRAFT_903638 [Irpex rosettiformis]
MPVIEELLLELLNTIILDLLWICTVWHALAKLQVYTESTLTVLKLSATLLRLTTQQFAKKCKKHDIHKLPTEESAQHHQKAREQEKKNGKHPQSSSNSNLKGKAKETRLKQKQLNLQMFKWHNLQHYVEAI